MVTKNNLVVAKILFSAVCLWQNVIYDVKKKKKNEKKRIQLLILWQKYTQTDTQTRALTDWHSYTLIH